MTLVVKAGVVSVSGQTVVEMGTTTVTVVGWSVNGQFVTVSGHWEIVISCVV